MASIHDPHEFDPAWVCRTCGQEAHDGDVALEIHTPGWDREGPTA